MFGDQNLLTNSPCWTRWVAWYILNKDVFLVNLAICGDFQLYINVELPVCFHLNLNILTQKNIIIKNNISKNSSAKIGKSGKQNVLPRCFIYFEYKIYSTLGTGHLFKDYAGISSFSIFHLIWILNPYSRWSSLPNPRLSTLFPLIIIIVGKKEVRNYGNS